MSTSEGSKIRMLSTHVANQIAAGEVVERPAAAVKELLENAIDAGASRIDLVITAGGRKLISIADNGVGMNRDDAIMAPERQATSKISSLEDIEQITTLGFRGEALASIASVSRFTLRTRRQQDLSGTEVTIVGGKLQDVTDCGCPAGTCIEVRDLFFNVPARRNFLRAYVTEQAHIRNIFIIQAIAYPQIAFSLKCDGDLIHQLPAAASLHDRILDLQGEDDFNRLVPVDSTVHDIHIYGFAGLPNWTRGDRNGQFIYINHRAAIAPVVLAAITEAYPKLEENRKPILYLFIDLAPDQVDVNVHPTKREVRFRNLAQIREAVITAITSAFSQAGIFSSPPTPSTPSTFSDSPQNTPSWTPPAPIPTPSFPPATIPPSAPVRPAPTFDFSPSPKAAFTATPSASTQPSPTTDSADFPETVVQMPSGSPWTQFRILGRLSPGYIVLETNDGYTLVDPSAAHERVLYEKLRGLSEQSERLSQALLIPQTIEMKPLDHRRVESVLPTLTEMGFEIHPFGKDAFIVQAVPDILSATSCEAILLDTAQALEDAPHGHRKHEKWREELVAKAASRAAVRTAGSLSPKELHAIIMDLAACEMPYTSPSGRPTMLFTSFRELHRRFGHS